MLKQRDAVRVAEIMTRDVVTVRADASVADAALLLDRRHFSGLPVCDERGAMVGVVSEFDIISKAGRTIKDIMSTDVVSITPSSGVEEVARIMTQLRIRRLPVVDAGRLVGIVTRGDLVHFFALNHWACGTCGAHSRGFEPPERCDICGAPADRFQLESAPPGM